MEKPMNKLIFSTEAIGSILTECYRLGNGKETGGIYIGTKKVKGVITDAIASTAFAERESHTYYQSLEDVGILNQKLRVHQAKDEDFRGYFHRHPTGMKNLSHGDKDTCKKILLSANYAINNCLIMSIITEVEGHNGIPMFSYVVSLNSLEEVVINEIPVKIMPKSFIEEFVECL
jgi:hypothetical protein